VFSTTAFQSTQVGLVVQLGSGRSKRVTVDDQICWSWRWKMLKRQNMEMWKRQNKMEMLEICEMSTGSWFLLRDNERHCSEFWWGLQTKMWKLDLRKNVLCLSQKTFSFVSARKHQDSVFVSEDVNFSGSLRKYYLFNLKCFWSLSGCWFSLWCLLLL